MNKPIIGENDLIYSYKEQCFTGFAPCFKNGLYSLACCKGGKKTGGMRVSICNQFEKNNGKNNIWVISIAGNNISKNDNDGTHQGYEPEDAICLAKITDIHTLEDYWNKYNKERIDTIYRLSNDKIEWRCNKVINGNGEHESKKHDFKSTDCAIGYKESSDKEAWSEKKIFQCLPQILVSKEYYVFKPKHKICEDNELYIKGQGFSFRKKGRAKALKEFVEKNCDFAYTSGEDPFINTSNNNTRGCK